MDTLREVIIVVLLLQYSGGNNEWQVNKTELVGLLSGYSALLEGGNTIVVWNSQDRILGQLFDSSKTLTGSQFNIETVSGNQRNPRTYKLHNIPGGYIVLYLSSTVINVRVFDNNGPLGATFNATPNSIVVVSYSAVVTKDNVIVVAATQGLAGVYSLYIQRLDMNGNLIGDRQHPYAMGGVTPQTVIDVFSDLTFVTVSSGSRGISINFFDQNCVYQKPLTILVDDANYPAVAVQSDDTMVVTYTKVSKAYIARYSKSGAFINSKGVDNRINNYNPFPISLSRNLFAVYWITKNDAGLFDLFVSVNDFLLKSSTLLLSSIVKDYGQYRTASITAWQPGGIVVMWTDKSTNSIEVAFLTIPDSFLPETSTETLLLETGTETSTETLLETSTETLLPETDTETVVFTETETSTPTAISVSDVVTKTISLSVIGVHSDTNSLTVLVTDNSTTSPPSNETLIPTSVPTNRIETQSPPSIETLSPSNSTLSPPTLSPLVPLNQKSTQNNFLWVIVLSGVGVFWVIIIWCYWRYKSKKYKKGIIPPTTLSDPLIVINDDEENAIQLDEHLSEEHEIPWDLFETLKYIGGGNFGKVYSATYRPTRETVAVKQSTDPTADFKKEVSILCNLRQRNILKFYGWALHEERLYLVTEYCEGGKLSTYSGIGRLEMIIKLTGITQALLYIHDQGYAHMDVAARNVLVDDAQVLKLADMGLFTPIGDLINKPLPVPWCSPTTLSTKVAGIGHDVWAFGCLIYEILAGHSPYRPVLVDKSRPPQERLSAVWKKIIAGVLPVKPSALSPREEHIWQQVVLRCWVSPKDQITLHEIMDILLSNSFESSSSTDLCTEHYMYSGVETAVYSDEDTLEIPLYCTDSVPLVPLIAS